MTPLLLRLTRIFRETLGRDDLILTLDTTPDDVEEWDSVAQVQLFLALETEFDVSLTPEELGSISSVRDIVDLLATHGVMDQAPSGRFGS
jgi:acyl carrier protein